MSKQYQEQIRRLLQAALDKLDAQTPGDEEVSITNLLTEGDANTPMILVLGGRVDRQDADAPTADTHAQDGHPVTVRSDPTHALHPGLERFPLAVTDSRLIAPKPCFMEPGRACVNSGACEMRGF